MPTRGELIAEALDSFLQACHDVEGAAVVSADGLPMASALPSDMEEDRLAAMSAAILSLGEKASDDLGRKQMEHVFIEGEEGAVHLIGAGPTAVLVAVTGKGSKAGLVLYEMKGTARAIAEALVKPKRDRQDLVTDNAAGTSGSLRGEDHEGSRSEDADRKAEASAGRSGVVG